MKTTKNELGDKLSAFEYIDQSCVNAMHEKHPDVTSRYGAGVYISVFVMGVVFIYMPISTPLHLPHTAYIYVYLLEANSIQTISYTRITDSPIFWIKRAKKILVMFFLRYRNVVLQVATKMKDMEMMKSTIF